MVNDTKKRDSVDCCFVVVFFGNERPFDFWSQRKQYFKSNSDISGVIDERETKAFHFCFRFNCFWILRSDRKNSYQTLDVVAKVEILGQGRNLASKLADPRSRALPPAVVWEMTCTKPRLGELHC